jgi:hypothetical protein
MALVFSIFNGMERSLLSICIEYAMVKASAAYIILLHLYTLQLLPTDTAR